MDKYRETGKDPPISGEQLDEILNKHSGLRGISGVSSDMRDILVEMQQGNDLAKLGIRHVCSSPAGRHRLHGCAARRHGRFDIRRWHWGTLAGHTSEDLR